MTEWVLPRSLPEIIREELLKNSLCDLAHWRSQGLSFLAQHAVNFKDDNLFVKAMMYLIASDTEIMEKIFKVLKEHGFKDGISDI